MTKAVEYLTSGMFVWRRSPRPRACFRQLRMETRVGSTSRIRSSSEQGHLTGHFLPFWGESRRASWIQPPVVSVYIPDPGSSFAAFSPRRACLFVILFNLYSLERDSEAQQNRWYGQTARLMSSGSRYPL